MRNCPPTLPSAANASFNVRKVVAAPHSDCRKARRSSPTCLACALIRRSASALARATGASSGTGRNSPLDVESTLTGSGPRKSLAIAHASASWTPSIVDFRVVRDLMFNLCSTLGSPYDRWRVAYVARGRLSGRGGNGNGRPTILAARALIFLVAAMPPPAARRAVLARLFAGRSILLMGSRAHTRLPSFGPKGRA